MSQPNPNEFSEENVVKLIIKYSLPVIVGLLVGASYNIIDRIFIGKSSGELGIAAVSVTFPIMMAVMAISNLIGMGATAIVSIRLGEKNRDGAERVMGTAFMLLILLSFLLTIPCLYFLEPILKAFGSSPEILPLAVDYIRIILFASIFMIVGSGMNNFIRADGNPKRSMFTLLIGSILNVILAPIFIFVFDWGIVGAALATAIAQLVSALWVMSYFWSGASGLKIRLKNLRISGSLCGQILSLGFGSFIPQISISIMFILLNNILLKYGGNTEVSAMGIVNTVQTFMMLPIWGLSLGIQPIIGFNYGAKEYNRVKAVMRSGLLFSTVLACVFFLFIALFSRNIVGIFTTESQELIDFGSRSIVTFLMLTPLLGLQILGAGYFQAIGKPKQSILLGLTRQVFFLIPALLIFPLFMGVNGVLVSGPVSDLCSSAVILTCLLISFGKTKQIDSQDQAIHVHE